MGQAEAEGSPPSQTVTERREEEAEDQERRVPERLLEPERGMRVRVQASQGTESLSSPAKAGLALMSRV